jgi:hypothetical protein
MLSCEQRVKLKEWHAFNVYSHCCFNLTLAIFLEVQNRQRTMSEAEFMDSEPLG